MPSKKKIATRHAGIEFNQKIKLGIIGCGAVSQTRYLPASNRVSNLEVAYVIDTDLERAESLAQEFNIPKWSSNYQDLFDSVDAVVVNTPPKLHADMAINCMKNGIHVLCEKPMAISLSDARQMVQTSRDTKTHLAIGMNRRLCGSSQLANTLLRDDFLGTINCVEVEEGYEFSWPLNSLHLFKKEEAGGGVLMGTGPHLLDLLFWLVSDDVKVNGYEHDDFGGLEANANLALTLRRNHHEIPCRIKLSLTRNLANQIRVHGEKGSLYISTLGGETISLSTPSDPNRLIELRPQETRNGGRIEEFAEQLSRFADSIQTGIIRYVTGDDAIAVIGCIEQCYQMAKSAAGPWEECNINPRVANVSVKNNGKPTVLITGSTGFVGSRLSERLTKGFHAHVRAMVNRLSNPGIARLARLPVDLAQGNVLDYERLLELTRSCDAIVHCAYGSKEVTVEGTRNVLEAAKRNSVGRVIHLSTSVVHGRNPNVEAIDESSPFKSDGDIYSESKISAEEEVWKYHKTYSLPVVVLRPTCIYGPYSRMWTIRPVNEIKTGEIAILDESVNSVANVIYIDNLIDVIILALLNEKALGEAFIVTDNDRITWAEFYRQYNDMFSNHPPLQKASLREIRNIERKKRFGGLKNSITFPFGICKAIAQSPKVAEEFRNQIWFRFIADKFSQEFKDRIKGIVKGSQNGNTYSGDGYLARHTSNKVPDSGLIHLYTSKLYCSNTKLKTILDWRQEISFKDAMFLTKQWLKYQGLI